MREHARSETLVQKCDKARVVLRGVQNSLGYMQRLALGSPRSRGGDPFDSKQQQQQLQLLRENHQHQVHSSYTDAENAENLPPLRSALALL